MTRTSVPQLGQGLPLTRMPAHWMLGRLGKRVMRPGGLGLSRWMLERLDIGPGDDVVELWPGLGATAEIALATGPRSYTGIERGEAEAARARAMFTGPGQGGPEQGGPGQGGPGQGGPGQGGAERECRVAPVAETGLADGSADVLYGEALLTLEPATAKLRTVAEARRLLRPGGRYGIHELLLIPDGLAEAAKDEIGRELTSVPKVGARPLTVSEWRRLLDEGGFEVREERVGPLLLLDPRTFVADEGARGTAGFLARSLANPAVLPRLATILRSLHRYRDHLGAVALVAERRPD